MTVKNQENMVERLRASAAPAPVENFLGGGFRLLHAQAGSSWTPPEVWCALEARGHKPTKSDYPDIHASFCCSFWKPGWGLHAANSVIELRLKPSSQVMAFTHDAWSNRSGTSNVPPTAIAGFAGRYLGTYSANSVNPHIECVKNAAELGRFRSKLKNREKDILGCKDPVNECWVRHQDILEVRAIQIVGPALVATWDVAGKVTIPRVEGSGVNTHKFDEIKIRVLTGWFPVVSYEEYYGKTRAGVKTTTK